MDKKAAYIHPADLLQRHSLQTLAPSGGVCPAGGEGAAPVVMSGRSRSRSWGQQLIQFHNRRLAQELQLTVNSTGEEWERREYVEGAQGSEITD
ncbi:hypothetical protein FQN60_013814 [Etheostoma spectabile]|uniref:Uncharacterized protein n=1 Tax=Etheostoma spectabile TaxID=54343 RepID=A0A5J5CK02_9PERO|nr:hypothetical protein FQN60_013814 [Etheostoma spectabile]